MKYRFFTLICSLTISVATFAQASGGQISRKPNSSINNRSQSKVHYKKRETQKIVYFEGDGNYTYIVTANKQKVCITMNLSHTEDALAAQLGENAKQFMRIGIPNSENKWS